ncbi:DinB family protein [Flavitalea sp. BT771]|uniref:DinB family protein n=1 Tax=Flavitalea sp. BT771 TaxID=3063329 RepID=UPI0026E45A4A|nr:DinB family protein [Flavitalea sp. BT771]MDO6432891.1 DinB family protein [Flavitalea sp. BT771]MDV6221833.1 DinB family protein [Flavitalea sp. BT771]
MEILSPGGRNVVRMSLSRDEREFAGEYLAFTKRLLLDSVTGLSNALLEARTGPFAWSIAECMGHLAQSGELTWKVLQDLLRQPPTPEKGVEIRVSVKQMMVIMTDRSRKLQTLSALDPAGKVTDFDLVRDRFTACRDRLIAFAWETENELKNRHTFHPATGTINLYQYLLLEGAHAARHVMQIEEIKREL